MPGFFKLYLDATPAGMKSIVNSAPSSIPVYVAFPGAVITGSVSHAEPMSVIEMLTMAVNNMVMFQV